LACRPALIPKGTDKPRQGGIEKNICFVSVDPVSGKSINALRMFRGKGTLVWGIENYLLQKWRDGALAGVRPKEAFWVRCGLGTTMNSRDIVEGRMNVEIGMAVVRPAEFIIIKFALIMQTS
jgi:phage tail sheath protein FI